MALLSVVAHSALNLAFFHLTLQHYRAILNSAYARVMLRSMALAFACVIWCFCIAFPMAFWLNTFSSKVKPFLLLLAIIPLWTSSLVRCYAIMVIIKARGLLNSALLWLGIIHHPLHLLFTNTSVMIGLVYNLMPFMLLPIYTNIERLDTNVFEAARDLGASKFYILRKVLLPMTMPGITAGSIMVFLPAMTLFYIPDLLGGARSLLLGNLIQQQFLFAGNWGEGSAIGVVLTILMLPLLWFYRYSQRTHAMGDLL